MSKFPILITIFLFACKLVNGQTEKGTQTLGADFRLGYSNQTDYAIYVGNNSTTVSKSTNFSIGPNYSYFIADKLDVGAAFSYSNAGLTNTTENSATANENTIVYLSNRNLDLSLFIRKYYMYKNKIGLRAGAYIGYTYENDKNTYTPTDAGYNYNSTTNYYNGGANLDLVFYPSKHLGLSATIANLEYADFKINNASQGHDDGDSLNFYFINKALSMSVFYVFGNK